MRVATLAVIALCLVTLTPVESSARGWYLMAPPWNINGDLDEARPLGEWDQINSFDTAQACEAFRKHLVEQLRDKEKPARDMAVRAWIAERRIGDPLRTKEGQHYARIAEAVARAEASRCFSAADPRLAPR